MLATGDKSVVNLGGTLLGALFGDRTGALTGAISSMSGMKSSSISTLLALAAPAVFSYLKGYLTQNNLGIGDLANLLAGQTDHLRASLDDRVARGLGFAGTGALLSSLTSAFAGRATGAAEKTAAAAWDAGRGVARAGEGAFATAGEAVRHVPAAVPVFQRPWFWALIGALILLGWALLQNWSPGPGVATKSLDLPDGRRIEVAAGGFLDSLAAFLAGTGMAAPKAFTFDDLHFETGSATLTEPAAGEPRRHAHRVPERHDQRERPHRRHWRSRREQEAVGRPRRGGAAGPGGTGSSRVTDHERGLRRGAAHRLERLGGRPGPEPACRIDGGEGLSRAAS
jgi:hypothetical protein